MSIGPILGWTLMCLLCGSVVVRRGVTWPFVLGSFFGGACIGLKHIRSFF
jgi:hypothetical protein